jgi:hypothetical protein
VLPFKLEIVLEDFDIFGWITYLHERSDENGVLVHLDNVVRPVHVDLHVVWLEFAELVLLDIVDKRTFSPSKMTAEN